MSFMDVLEQAGAVVWRLAKPLVDLGRLLLAPIVQKYKRAPLIPEEDEIRGEPGQPAEARPDRIPDPSRRFSFVGADAVPVAEREIYVGRIAQAKDREPLPSLAHARVGDLVLALIDCPKGRSEHCSPIMGRVVHPKRDSFRVRLEWVPDRKSSHGLAPGGWLDIPHAAVLVALPITAAG